MRSVFVTKFVPTPPNSGDKRRGLGITRALLERGPVTVVAFCGEAEDVDLLRAEGVDVVPVALERTPAHLAEGLLRTASLTGARFWSPELATAVRQASAGADVLMVTHVQFMAYARGLDVGTRVLDMHNVESMLAGRLARSATGLRKLAWTVETRALRRLEGAIDDFDVVTVVSEVDRKALAEVAPHPTVLVVGNGWDAVTPLPPAPDPVVSFVALQSWSPNVDASCWFTEKVWPRVRSTVPAARLQLVGRDPAPRVTALAGPAVVVSGTVDDLTPWYADTRVAVAPLLAGGGSRLKILEALSYGRPVVATRIGAEGLEDLHGRGVDVADDPDQMADQISALLLDPDRAAREGARGAEAVQQDHSWTGATRPLLAELSTRSPS